MVREEASKKEGPDSLFYNNPILLRTNPVLRDPSKYLEMGINPSEDGTPFSAPPLP
jgi:hypothetical protein